MALYADLNLTAPGIIGWLIVGLIAGALAGNVMRGGGYGILGDIVIGLIGAFVGGFLASLIGMQGSTGLIGSIVVAFVGACVMIALVRAIAPRRAI